MLKLMTSIVLKKYLTKRLNHNIGTTIIIITHDENMALYADKKIVIEEGKITNMYVKKVNNS